MKKVYDSRTKEWVEAEYDPITNHYYDVNGRSLGSKEDKYSYGTAILPTDVDYDPISNAYYRKRDGKPIADGPNDD